MALITFVQQPTEVLKVQGGSSGGGTGHKGAASTAAAPCSGWLATRTAKAATSPTREVPAGRANLGVISIASATSDVVKTSLSCIVRAKPNAQTSPYVFSNTIHARARWLAVHQSVDTHHHMLLSVLLHAGDRIGLANGAARLHGTCCAIL
eukprot:364637-Chlamydomonas_euryale.AAC.7